MLRSLLLLIVLLGSVMPTHAQPHKKFLDWYASNATSDTVYAGTINDSQQVFGQFCYIETANCIWILAVDKTCVKGEKHVALINSEAGAVATELLCSDGPTDGKYRYAFINFDDIDRTVRGASRFGIAIPVKGGTFTVVRFSLKGAVDAVDTMHADGLNRRRSAPITPAPPNASTRDLNL